MNNEALKILHHDFTVCKSYLQTVAMALRKDSVSKYPIFVAIHNEQDLDIGVPILRSEETETYYSFNASHLEDFVNRGVVRQENVKDFISSFKDAEKYCCIFLTEPESANFVFIPYSNENVWEPKYREELN